MLITASAEACTYWRKAMPRSIARVAGRTMWVAAALALCTVAGAQPKDDIKKMIKDHKQKKDLAPSLGSDAPNFKLKMLKSDQEVELASFKGKKPVVLVFGSYT